MTESTTAAPPATTTSAKPQVAPSSSRGKTTASGTDYVDTDSGVLVHRVSTSPRFYSIMVLVLILFKVVPDDNSCLFSSVALVFEGSMSKAPMIRKGINVSET